MSNFNTEIPAKYLHQVLKPGRYTGGEFAGIYKEDNEVDVTFALAFPDVYEVGMSYLGFKILYHILNSQSYIWAQRTYTPWVDMQDIMRREDITLSCLESKRALCKFDFVGFTLQYEMSYTNILTMLDLGKIPLYASERNIEQPFVVGGGPCVYNPEPLAEFFDLFVIGEGEEVLLDLTKAYKDWKNNGRQGGRSGFLAIAAGIDGIYVPSFYDVSYDEQGCTTKIKPIHPIAKEVIYKRVVADLDAVDYPTAPIVPFIDIVHNRIMMEVFRGCTRGCRFCHAGMVYRPVRERSKEKIKSLVRQLVANTGYDEVSLISLSTADYSCLQPLLIELLDELKQDKVSVSLPSLRIDSFSVQLAQKVQEVRKSSLTFAPEAGSQRMRDVINKGVTEDDLLNAVTSAFSAGWSGIKLYFMIGLPTETDEDIKAIADLAYKVLDCYRNVKGRGGAKVTVSVSNFVPKPHTPFQWLPQTSKAELSRRQQLLRSLLQHKNITYQYHDSTVSRLEGVFARGNRKLGAVLYAAYQNGAKFDGWSEKFSMSAWQQAFESCGINPDFYTDRNIDQGELLPWEHIQPAVNKEFLYREYKKALAEELTVDCRRSTCSACGVCSTLGVKVIDWQVENQ